MKTIKQYLTESFDDIPRDIEREFKKNPKLYDSMNFVIELIKENAFGTKYDKNNVLNYFYITLTEDGIQCEKSRYSDEMAIKIQDIVDAYNKKHNTDWKAHVVGSHYGKWLPPIFNIKPIYDLLKEKYEDFWWMGGDNLFNPKK